MLGRIDHIGVAVDDIDASLAVYREQLELEVEHREVVDAFGVDAALLGVGDGHVELLAPLGPDTPVGRYMERHGPGLHHVAYAVEDIDAELERLKATGLRLIDQRARTGIRDSRVAFLHPRTLGGVLTELVEPAEGH